MNPLLPFDPSSGFWQDRSEQEAMGIPETREESPGGSLMQRRMMTEPAFTEVGQGRGRASRV
jgi:hypothetical protein